jgi:tryptophan halogenase
MKINKIVIVGGGSAGWMTAATLVKAFPDKEICLIESPGVPTVGVGESTLGGIRTWCRWLGIDDRPDLFFKSTNASLKLSIKFTDFHKKNGGAFHYPFGKAMLDGDRNPFFDWEVKKYYYPETPVEDFSRCIFSASSLFENNKYSLNETGEFDNFNPNDDVAYHFDAAKFGEWLKVNYCVPNGVEHIQATVAELPTDESGIKHLVLDSGEVVTADLFVDCTGFKSLLLSEALKEPFISYSDMLPNNSAWATQIPYKDKENELEGFTNCTAIENGWCWNIPLWSRVGTGYVYSDKFVDAETAKEEFKQYLMSDKMVVPRTREEVDAFTYRPIKMRVGIHERTWVKNVVAIGLSAGFIEPLESNGLFSVHEFLWKLLDVLYLEDINQFNRDMYNETVHDQFNDFAKFVVLHYALSKRDDTPYWQAIANKEFRDPVTNEPHTNNSLRIATFHDMIWRYMINWSHPFGMGGITYIAVGQHVRMLNPRRVADIEYFRKRDLRKELNVINDIWEAKKARWQRAADNSPTLYQYLKDTFYGEDEDLD